MKTHRTTFLGIISFVSNSSGLVHGLGTKELTRVYLSPRTNRSNETEKTPDEITYDDP